MKRKKGSQNEERLIKAYKNLRLATIEVEYFIEEVQPINDGHFTEQDMHRLDKAVVVSKVAFKMVKKILKKHGFKGLKAEAMKESGI